MAAAIGTAALATRQRPAFDGLDLAAGPGVIPRRVTRLLATGRRRYPALLRLLPVVLAAASIVWTGEAMRNMVELLMAARVP